MFLYYRCVGVITAVSTPVALSAGLRNWALFNGVDIAFMSKRGSYLGQLQPNSTRVSTDTVVKQLRFRESPEAGLKLAKQIVQAKINNQVLVLRKMLRGQKREVCEAVRDRIAQMQEMSKRAGDAKKTESLLGYEGTSSKLYFEAWALFLPDSVNFTGRNRRPPKDLVNSALGYLYAVLQSECEGALRLAGLEPVLGILHADSQKRPSLTLDFMEEFRPLLVDRVVLSLVRRKQLRPEHCYPEEGGVYLNKEGKKIVVDAYEATLQRTVKGALPGFAGSWRRHILHQAQRLAQAVAKPSYDWSPVTWR